MKKLIFIILLLLVSIEGFKLLQNYRQKQLDHAKLVHEKPGKDSTKFIAKREGEKKKNKKMKALAQAEKLSVYRHKYLTAYNSATPTAFDLLSSEKVKESAQAKRTIFLYTLTLSDFKNYENHSKNFKDDMDRIVLQAQRDYDEELKEQKQKLEAYNDAQKQANPKWPTVGNVTEIVVVTIIVTAAIVSFSPVPRNSPYVK